ncbi:MAG: SDR family oxidoreductase [Ferrovibrio sp.]
MTVDTRPVTLVGATGKLGQHVARRLLTRGIPVIPVVRRPERLMPGLRGIARVFDLDRPETIKPVLQDAKLFVSCVHGRHGADLIAALPRDVERVVLLGSTRIFTRFPDPNVAELQHSADALAQSGFSGVMLHPTMIYGAAAENNLQRIAAYIRKLGIIPLPDGGRTLLQPIHVEDVARCVEAALYRDEAPGAPIVVAGPEPITYRDLVMAVGAAIKRKPFILPIPGPLLELIAMFTAILPLLPRIRRDEIRRLSEDKAFPIDEMMQRLGVQSMPLSQGLAKTFTGSDAAAP